MLDKALRSAVLGRNQTFTYINEFSAEIAPPEKERSLIRSLHYAISNSQLDKIKTNMTSLFALWEAEGLPVQRAASALTGLIQLITDYAPISGEDKLGDIPSFTFRLCN
jgi:hypothetical protein